MNTQRRERDTHDEKHGPWKEIMIQNALEFLELGGS